MSWIARRASPAVVCTSSSTMSGSSSTAICLATVASVPAPTTLMPGPLAPVRKAWRVNGSSDPTSTLNCRRSVARADETRGHDCSTKSSLNGAGGSPGKPASRWIVAGFASEVPLTENASTGWPWDTSGSVPAQEARSKGKCRPRRWVHNTPRRRSNTSDERRGATYDAAMPSPGGSRHFTLPESARESPELAARGGGLSGGEPLHPTGEDLQRALDRLSLSLERIHGLLEELRNSRRMQGEPRSTSDARAEHAIAPELVHGGGPSAFERH